MGILKEDKRDTVTLFKESNRDWRAKSLITRISQPLMLLFFSHFLHMLLCYKPDQWSRCVSGIVFMVLNFIVLLWIRTSV